MEPIDTRDINDIGWHLIARGGDMTARVHPSMCLGVLPSGDLSFEPPDAVVELDLAGQALTLSIVADAYELETESGERTRTIRVSPQTHVCLDFMGHMLDIDNDFAVASPPGDALALFVVRHGEVKRPLGPLSAPAHGAAEEIVVPERVAGTELTALPVDYLQREHAAAAADKRKAAPHRSGVWKIAGALVGSLAVILGLATVAVYVADLRPAAGGPETSAAESPPGEEIPVADATAPTLTPVPASTATPIPEQDPTVNGAPMLGDDVLASFSDLLESEPLPDKATLEFAIESLRSLMAAYPADARIPAALASLNERLVREARESYDTGDALRAGRLIEQAAALGLAEASVEETLAYFEQQPPGRSAIETAAEEALPEPVVDTSPDESETVAESASELTDAEAEAMLIEALDRELADAGPARAATDDGLDSLVESATGLALGALAVEIEFEDAPATQSLPVRSEPAGFGPMQPAALAAGNGAGTVEGEVRSALDTVLLDAADPVVSANELPVGYSLESPGATVPPPLEEPTLIAPEQPAAGPGPEFRAYSELTVRRHVPLVYPRRALEGSEGSIEVEFTVTESGRVVDVNVRGDAPSIFLRAAVRTIRQWEFVPVRQNGRVVPVRTALRVTYRG